MPRMSRYDRVNDGSGTYSLQSFLPGEPQSGVQVPYLSRANRSAFSPEREKEKGKLRELAVSYAPDWVVIVVLAAVFFLLLDYVPGFKREFSVTDTSLSHTFAVHERVPSVALYLIALVAPIALQWAVNLVLIRSWWDAHSSALGLVLGFSLTGAITQFVKLTVGRPRPDLLARCLPTPGTVDPIFGLSTIAICNPTSLSRLEDGFKSFPSGHSSLSFAGLGFFALYLAGKTHLFDKRGHVAKAWLSLIPLSAAALVAISRTMDYRHHWQDVTAGSLLGFTIAYFAYRQYYPSLSSEVSHTPYPPRTQRSEPVLPVHRAAASRS
ncbi:PAP2-domain-containing protein [Artomyces pyxidatus]|uniref:PAP2-domain-containing protein n=1 Tax=Artomyces pyxidatus TaxID=48021 RepID=A0ACB8T7A2_9AGAM|nr:PAP2-domain-containing protein [Artomyces pyxidatus]